jgi:hypothetical protein
VEDMARGQAQDVMADHPGMVGRCQQWAASGLHSRQKGWRVGTQLGHALHTLRFASGRMNNG